MRQYDPRDWYWIVQDVEGDNVYKSSIGDFVSVQDADYLAFLADQNVPTSIASKAELGEVLADARVRPTNADVLDGFKGRHAETLTMAVVAKILFWLVNEVRTLKGQNKVNANQFKSFLKDQM